MPLWYRNIRKKLHLDIMCNEIIKNKKKEEAELTPTLQNNHPSKELSNLVRFCFDFAVTAICPDRCMFIISTNTWLIPMFTLLSNVNSRNN